MAHSLPNQCDAKSRMFFYEHVFVIFVLCRTIDSYSSQAQLASVMESRRTVCLLTRTNSLLGGVSDVRFCFLARPERITAR